LPESAGYFERRVRGDTLEQIAKPGAEFGQPFKGREQRVKRPSMQQKSMQTGSCAAERQLWREKSGYV